VPQNLPLEPNLKWRIKMEKIKKIKVQSWKNKPIASEVKRFKRDVNSKRNIINEF
jgi:hypothetical protein